MLTLVERQGLPFAGPPSYEMVSRRLSALEVDPQSYFLHKREQKARPSKSGNVNSVPKKIYFTPKKLKSEIAEDLGIPFLAPATQADA
jgi:hypothetical protein